MSTSSDTGLSAEQVEAVENMALTDGGEATATPETPAGENQTTNETTATGAEGADGDGQQQSNGDSKAEAEVGTDTQNGRPDKQSRLNQRFAALTSQLHEKDEYIESLKQEMARKNQQDQLKPPTPDEDGNYSASDIMDYNQKQAQQAANTAVEAMQERLDGEQVASRFDREEAEILKAYPMLDPNNASLDPTDPNCYNKTLAKAVDSYVRGRIEPHILARNVGALKKLSIRKLADEYLEPIMSVAQAERERAQQSLQNLNGQSSGMFSSAAGSGGGGDSIEELEARIGNISLS